MLAIVEEAYCLDCDVSLKTYNTEKDPLLLKTCAVCGAALTPLHVSHDEVVSEHFNMSDLGEGGE